MEHEHIRYSELNKLAETNGIVILGMENDKNIPVGEIRQALAIETKIYNRSFNKISVNNAIKIYDEYIDILFPETLLIHIGEADKSLFEDNKEKFDENYRKLVRHIKNKNSNCCIVIVNLKNTNNNLIIEEMNKHLKDIAESEQCEYGDISSKQEDNRNIHESAVSFVFSTGFVHPVRIKHSIYYLTSILFSYRS